MSATKFENNILPILVSAARKKNYVSLSVNHQALQDRLNLCQHSNCKTDSSKGDKPWILRDLKRRLSEILAISNWRLIYLSKGYYHVILTSENGKTGRWARSALICKPRILRLQEWSLFFNPLVQKSTNVQVWVRFYRLNWVFCLDFIRHSSQYFGFTRTL